MVYLADIWRRWRRQIKSAAPFVRRREHRIVERKYARLIESINGLAVPANRASIQVLKPPLKSLVGDVCLFVTHAPQAALKTHVAHHLLALLEAGVQVILIANTDLAPDTLVIGADLAARLSGVIVRQNTGFDFGAWGHAWSMLDHSGWQRLYLVNDSVVGPLDAAAFARMIARIKNTPSDFIGLTESLAPQRHLQSYFLVFNRSVLIEPAFDSMMRGVLNFPDKGQVVDVYECSLTWQFRALGLHFEALFPALTPDSHNSDDTLIRWERLLEAGFPYLKTRVIRQFPAHPLVQAARATGRVDSQI
jgi:lipopolysaccharide biosynthesis protein